MPKSRYDFNALGKRYVTYLMMFTILLVTAYLSLKAIFPVSCKDPVSECEFIFMNPRGEVIHVNKGALDWYVGGDDASELAKKLHENTETIKTTFKSFLENIAKLEFTLWGDSRWGADEIRGLATQGEFCAVDERFKDLFKNYLSSVTIDQFPPNLKSVLELEIIQLSELKHEQCQLVDSLKKTGGYTVFWANPGGVAAEVTFWSLFGVLTNLLLNSALFLAGNNYRPREIWVGMTKIIYAPIIALVLVFAFIAGFMDFGDYAVRANSIPVVAFILGYSVRKSVTLLEKLSSRILGNAEKSTEEGPEAIRERMNKRLEAYKKPKNIPDLRASANSLAHEMIVSLVREKEAQR